MERFSRDTMSLTKNEFDNLVANQALEPTVEYWVDQNRFLNATSNTEYFELCPCSAGPFSIEGTPMVGQTLRVVPEQGWSVTGQWTRNGVAIPGATAHTYVLTSADVPGPITFLGANPPYSPPAQAVAGSGAVEVVSARVDERNASWVIVEFNQAMDISKAADPLYNYVAGRRVVASTWDGASRLRLQVAPAMLPGERATITVGGHYAVSAAAGRMNIKANLPLANPLAQPAAATPVTTTGVLPYGEIIYGLTADWTLPAGEDFCFAFMAAGPVTPTAGKFIHLFSSGARAAQNSVNIYIPHITAANPGQLEVAIRGAGDDAGVVLSTLFPVTDGIARVYILQRSGGNIVTLKSCDIMGAQPVTHATATFAGGIVMSGEPTVAKSQALTAGETWVSMLREFGKGRFALTNAEIVALAAGQGFDKLAGRSWAVHTRYDSANALVDTTGRNPVTRAVGLSNVAGPTYGPVLQMVEPQDKQVLQRAVSGTRAVKVRGHWNGPAGPIEARVIHHRTGGTITNWIEIANNAQGYFDGDVQCAATTAWLTLEVRSKAYPSVMQRTYNRLGVGIVVLAIGPSNVYGLFDKLGGQPLAHDMVSYYQPETCSWTMPYGVGARTYMNGLRTATNLPIAMIRACQPGTGLDRDEGAGRWETRDDYDPYSWAIYNKEQWGGDIEAILTQTGGQDARQFGTYQGHYDAHTRLYADLRAEFGRSAAQLPWVATTVCRYEVNNPGADMNFRYQEIRSAQQNWLDATAGTVQAGCTVDLRVPLDGGLHFDSLQQLAHGRRLLQSHLVYLGLAGGAASAKGPVLTTATRNGSNVDLAVRHNGGTALRSRAAGVVTGMEVALASDTAFASKLAIASTSFPTGSTIRLVLASDPRAPVRVRYLYGANPGGATVASDTTNFVYDNRTIQGDTQGAPVLPTVADLVTA